MAVYKINDKDLSDFGIVVEKLTGFEKLPKRKGNTETDKLYENGVIADTTNIFYEARDLELKAKLIADSILDAQSKFLEFQNWVYQSGELELFVEYLLRRFVFYIKDAPIGKRIGDISGQVVYDISMKLREIDPSETDILEKALLIDFDTSQLVDFDGSRLYVY